MDDETKHFIQELLNLIVEQRKSISKLSAMSGLQHSATLALLNKAGTFTDIEPAIIESYEKIRLSTEKMILDAESREDFDAFRELLDIKFLG